MRVKTIHLNRRELPQRITLVVSSEELSFIETHLALPYELEPQETARGFRLKLPVLSAAFILRACGEMSSASSPNYGISSELFDGLDGIFNMFYDDGYNEYFAFLEADC